MMYGNARGMFSRILDSFTDVYPFPFSDKDARTLYFTANDKFELVKNTMFLTNDIIKICDLDECDTIRQQIASLTEEHNALREQVASLTAECDALRQQAEADSAGKEASPKRRGSYIRVIAALLNRLKIDPASRDAASSVLQKIQEHPAGLELGRDTVKDILNEVQKVIS